MEKRILFLAAIPMGNCRMFKAVGDEIGDEVDEQFKRVKIANGG